jgi:hypothetical protein
MFKNNDHVNIGILKSKFGYNERILKLVGLYCKSKCIDDILIWNQLYGKINQYRCVSDIPDDVIKIVEKLSLKFKEMKEKALKCLKCDINKVSILYIPCGHLIICSKCRSDKRCDLCHTIINETHTIYL